MRAPIIKESYFNPTLDTAINSALLRAINEVAFGKKYNAAEDAFENAKNIPWWGVSIMDEHDVVKNGEKEPHYYIQIGEGEYKMHAPKAFKTRYLDYESTDKGTIERNPGWWTITVWVPDGVSARKIAEIVDEAYKEVMAKVLPEYYIMSSELMDA